MVAFEIAAGTVIGRDHRHVGRNNQDAWVVTHDEDLTVGIVADGCSSGAHSEVGAKLGVKILAENLRLQYRQRQSVDWDRAMRQVLARIDVLVGSMGGNYRQVVEEYFLFTLVGVVIDARNATFFALGDGTVIVNGTQLPLGPFPNNAPPYMGYGLLDGRVDIDQNLIRLTPWEPVESDALHHFLVGSDGVDDISAHRERMMPGLTQPIGPVSQFWEQDRYFGGNEVLVSRQLNLMGRDWPRTNPDAGLLSDDTTIIVGRKAPNGDDG